MSGRKRRSYLCGAGRIFGIARRGLLGAHSQLMRGRGRTHRKFVICIVRCGRRVIYYSGKLTTFSERNAGKETDKRKEGESEANTQKGESDIVAYPLCCITGTGNLHV
jgi:hypothetical protein